MVITLLVLLHRQKLTMKPMFIWYSLSRIAPEIMKNRCGVIRKSGVLATRLDRIFTLALWCVCVDFTTNLVKLLFYQIMVSPVVSFLSFVKRKYIVFNALTLLVGHQEDHSPCKN